MGREGFLGAFAFWRVGVVMVESILDLILYKWVIGVVQQKADWVLFLERAATCGTKAMYYPVD